MAKKPLQCFPPVLRWVSYALIAAGLLLLFIFIPRAFWVIILAAVLVLVGVILLRV